MCFMLKRIFFSLSLASFFIFISMGNLFRFLENSLFSDNLIVSEALLYFFCFGSLFFVVIPKKAFLKLFSFLLVVVFSFLYGCMLNGFDLRASLYALRLILFGLSSYSLALICLELFQGSVEKFFFFLYKAYFLGAIIGFLLYIVFPSSSLLWDVLANYHIGFRGDPHEGRFVSVYFDPNYYCAIAGFAFLIASYLYQATKNLWYLCGCGVFFISGILTWSRSGIVLLCSVLFYKVFFGVCKGRYTKRGLLLCSVFCLGMPLFVLFYLEDMQFFIHRTLTFFEEDSALCRLETFRLGLDLFFQNPLLGVGLGFLYQYTQGQVSLSSLDSSLLSLLVQIGLIPFLLASLYVVYRGIGVMSVNSFWKQRKHNNDFFSWLIFYIGIVVIFSSQFNNILFYPFWLLPLLTTYVFIVRSLYLERQLPVSKTAQ